MKRLFAVLTLAAMLALSGCHNNQQRPREIIILPDLSASIDKLSQQQMFAAIKDAALHLSRGDSLTIIPITGDAEAELQGRTLHYAVPSESDRQAYDADIHSLHTQIKDDLARLQDDALAHAGKQTDILGSIRVAIKEFSCEPTEKQLVIMSDFIQDDKQFNFRKDPRLASAAEALVLGKGLVLTVKDCPKLKVVLGRLRSNEFSTLAPARQQGINTFWEQVMSPAVVDPDGTAAFLRNSQVR